MLYKKSKNTPPNFVDLRPITKSKPKSLIHDVLPTKTNNKRSNHLVIGVAGLIVFIVFSGLRPPKHNAPHSNFTASSFRVYYPNQSKLPSGYKFNNNSKSNKQTVIYTVGSATHQLVFTIQQKPSSETLQNFLTHVIPLHTSLATSIGSAEIGAANNETIVSLPTDSNAWILVTATYNTPSNQLDQILLSL
jgi:hypothetical protein